MKFVALGVYIAIGLLVMSWFKDSGARKNPAFFLFILGWPVFMVYYVVSSLITLWCEMGKHDD